MDLMTSDLFKYMMHRPSYCSENAVRWTAQIALGINALHDIGIIHRDIKPENILIDVRENVRIADYGLCYIDEYRRPLDREWAYTTSAAGTTSYMAPEVLGNIINPRSEEYYGTPVDWWSLGCVVYQLFSEEHGALFYKKDDILYYVSWCDRISRQHHFFKDFPPIIAELLSGLLDPNLSTRYGFPEVVCHRSFVRSCGESEFTDARSRARKRKALPNLLPDLQQDQNTAEAEVWHRLASWEGPRVPNIDWVKPTLFSFS
ncbi:kinase-like protein [Suillus brevipes Sb2]|nr:kinase-like protein [Suillus brevipes Sb2]